MLQAKGAARGNSLGRGEAVMLPKGVNGQWDWSLLRERKEERYESDFRHKR